MPMLKISPLILFSTLCILLLPMLALALEDIEQTPGEDAHLESTIRTLSSFITLHSELKSDIKRLASEPDKAQSASEKREIQTQLTLHQAETTN